MSQFPSWIEYKGKNYYLRNADLNTKKGKKLLNAEWTDLCGYGAIQSYYPELEGKGVHKECTDFSTPDNFPSEIVTDLKAGNLSRIGICTDILNEAGKKEYDKRKQLAEEEYYKKLQSAREEYYKIEHLAREERYKKERAARKERNKKIHLARKEYYKIEHLAREEHNKKLQLAEKEYNEKCSTAFTRIVKQKKYRNNAWK